MTTQTQTPPVSTAIGFIGIATGAMSGALIGLIGPYALIGLLASLALISTAAVLAHYNR